VANYTRAVNGIRGRAMNRIRGRYGNNPKISKDINQAAKVTSGTGAKGSRAGAAEDFANAGATASGPGVGSSIPKGSRAGLAEEMSTAGNVTKNKHWAQKYAEKVGGVLNPKEAWNNSTGIIDFGKRYYGGAGWKKGMARGAATLSGLDAAGNLLGGGSMTKDGKGRNDIAGIPFL
jgi:hypothetical protein